VRSKTHEGTHSIIVIDSKPGHTAVKGEDAALPNRSLVSWGISMKYVVYPDEGAGCASNAPGSVLGQSNSQS